MCESSHSRCVVVCRGTEKMLAALFTGIFMNLCSVSSATEGASVSTLKSRPHQLVHNSSVWCHCLVLCLVLSYFSTSGGTCGAQQTELMCLSTRYKGFAVKLEILQQPQLLPSWRLVAKQASNSNYIHHHLGRTI